MSDTSALSARERLALSHKAIVRQMNHDSAETAPTDEAARPEIDASASSWDLGRQVVSAWWRNHPAHLVVDLARPVLSTYAEDQPLKLLGISAGLGAAVVLLRPWRLMSVTGALLAAVKSPHLSGVVGSLLSGAGTNRHR
ncbi:MAG: hypothetical protein Q8K71_13090 [Polaromonas sp.]|nr:hypothetical protein [Polaromonas sp.]MDP3751350.1 hypothetical protein [Polaromonas sp.]